MAVFPEMKHIWQSLNNCGPAAVVMALSTFGVDANQEDARLALRGPDVRRGMGPQGVGPWVKDKWDLRSTWRNGGTNDLMRRLIANGFVPMVTQWMQDPTVSRIAHWRTVRGYDDAQGVFFVNDSMLGNMVALPYDWFGRNWQSFQYRYMVIYHAEDAGHELLVAGVRRGRVRERRLRRSCRRLRARLQQRLGRGRVRRAQLVPAGAARTRPPHRGRRHRAEDQRLDARAIDGRAGAGFVRGVPRDPPQYALRDAADRIAWRGHEPAINVTSLTRRRAQRVGRGR